MTGRLLALLLLAGCASTPVAPEDPPVPAIRCADACSETCNTLVPKWNPPNPASPKAWDTIRPQVVDPMAAELKRCELRRQSCNACIDAAVESGAVTR